MAVPQAGHQGRGFHTGLAAAVPDCIPVAQPEGFLGRQKSQKVLRLPYWSSQNFSRNLPRLSSLLSCTELGSVQEFCFIHFTVYSWISCSRATGLPGLKDLLNLHEMHLSAEGKKYLFWSLYTSQTSEVFVVVSANYLTSFPICLPILIMGANTA